MIPTFIIFYDIFRSTWIYLRFLVTFCTLIVMMSDTHFYVNTTFFSSKSDKIRCLIYSPLLICRGVRAHRPWYISKKDKLQMWCYSDMVYTCPHLLYRSCMFVFIYLYCCLSVVDQYPSSINAICLWYLQIFLVISLYQHSNKYRHWLFPNLA